MTPSKLTEADKRTILDLYRHPGETTTSLADRYGVSNSTIGRVLKNCLAPEEYDALIQQKRQYRAQPPGDLPEPGTLSLPPLEVLPPTQGVQSEDWGEDEEEDGGEEEMGRGIHPAPDNSEATSPILPASPLRPAQSPPILKRQLFPKAEASPRMADEPVAQLEFLSPLPLTPEPSWSSPAEAGEQDTGSLDLTYQEADYRDFAEDDDDDEDFDSFADEEGDLDDGDDEDLDDDMEDEDDLDEEDRPIRRVGDTEIMLQILPFTSAAMPKTCYIVVDRMAELITRPLKDFRELGQVPEAEIQSKTLPVFDNHRIAKRFSRQNQRIIKVPDANVLQKVTPYLQAKGITRLLLDGRVYAL